MSENSSYDNGCDDERSDEKERSSTDGQDTVTNKSSANQEIGAKESTTVNRLRLVVFLVLLIAAILVSLIVYFVTSNGEESEFVSHYNGLVAQMKREFHGIVNQRFSAIGSIRVALIAHAVDHGESWPFVTLTKFQERASTARKLSGSSCISTFPLVKESERHEWEKFVAEEGPYWM